MNKSDGETPGGDGLPGPAPRNLQGHQRKARGSGRGALGGPGFANVPPDLQLEFNWFFTEVLAAVPSPGGTAPAMPHWKMMIIRAIGNMLHALMIFGVSYNVVTHADQHNSDGSHKTVQAEGTTRRADRPTTESRNLKTDGDEPDGVLPDGQCKPLRPSWMDEIKAMLAEVRDGVVGLAVKCEPHGRCKTPAVEPVAGGSTTGNLPRDQAFGENKCIRTIGRFQYGDGFKDVWLDDEHYDLRKRRKARFCLEYLAAKKAFDAASARHFENEIDPYVRKKGRLGERGKFSDIQIKQYFNDRDGHLPKLRKALICSVAGTGKYYLATGAT